MAYILSSELVRLDRNDTTSNDTRDIRNTEALSNNDVVPNGTILAAALYAKNTRTISIAEYVNVSNDEYSGNCMIKVWLIGTIIKEDESSPPRVLSLFFFFLFVSVCSSPC
jgi:hypothetical protein